MTEEHHDHPHVNYWNIFFALCVLTAISVVADLMKEGMGKYMLIAAVMGVACAKALFVMGWFMHLKFEKGWKYIILLPTTVLALAIPFALAPDIGVHYYDVAVPQTNTLLDKEREEAGKEKQEDHHDHDAAEHGGGH